jgi:hypothetical protein
MFEKTTTFASILASAMILGHDSRSRSWNDTERHRSRGPHLGRQRCTPVRDPRAAMYGMQSRPEISRRTHRTHVRRPKAGCGVWLRARVPFVPRLAVVGHNVLLLGSKGLRARHRMDCVRNHRFVHVDQLGRLGVGIKERDLEASEEKGDAKVGRDRQEVCEATIRY